ncbi:MAG: hypothetical protein JXB88_23720 [Spirochaetales bacterium]|nr:hypothetical protein [Spirochaetales bacterium]
MTGVKDVINTNFVKVEQSILSLTRERKNLGILDEKGVYSARELVPYEMLMMRFERALEIICNVFFRAVEIAEYGDLSGDTPSCIAKMKCLSLIISEELWMEMINNRSGISFPLQPEIRIKLCNKILTIYIDELNEFCRRVENRYPVKHP